MKNITLSLIALAATSAAATITWDLNGDFTSTGSDAQVTVSSLTDLGNGPGVSLTATQLEFDRSQGGPFGGGAPQSVPADVFFSFTVTNNTAFTITLDSFTNVNGTGNAGVNAVSIVDSSGNTVFAVNNNNTDSTPSGDFSIAGNSTETFFIDLNSNGGNTFTTSDSFSLVATPEPSSAALLGLGGLALVARRRR